MKKEHQDIKLKDREVLLKLARNSINNYLAGNLQSEKINAQGWLMDNCGAFVSIHTKKGELRGCLGQFTSDKPLYLLIQELAISSASRDYRFSPIKNSELENITIEISVLSPLEKINSIDEIIAGTHGIYIKRGNHSGTFLPQVMVENNWDTETFVSRCAQDKARIGPNGWKDAELYVYTAEIFSDK